MIQNDKEKWVFVSTPKCATHTMYSALTSIGGKRYGLGWHPRDLSLINRQDYFSFTVCRNPYSRAVSLWWTTCRPDKEPSWDHYKFRREIKDYYKFESFMEWLVGPGMANWRNDQAAKCPQTLWQKGMRLNAVVHIENLENEINALPFMGERKIKLKTLNKANPFKLDCLAYMTPRAAECVRAWALNDFMRFGYSVEVGDERVGIASAEARTQDDGTRRIIS